MLKAANWPGRAHQYHPDHRGPRHVLQADQPVRHRPRPCGGVVRGGSLALYDGHVEECVDPRGKGYLRSVFGEIADAMGCTDAQAAIARFQAFLADLELAPPERKGEGELQLLKTSVNPVRLKNNPVRLDEGALETLYRRILAID